MEPWLQVVIAALGSSGLMTFITFLITRYDKKHDSREEFARRISALEASDEKIRQDVEFSRKANHLNLKDRVQYLTEDAVTRGCISVAALAYIEEAVTLLHEDGENGTMTACLESVKKLAIKQ